MSFSTLNLSPRLLKTLSNLNYNQPTPIQQKAIPAILSGKDVLAAAQTGTGKTAAFTLPLLQRLTKGEAARPHHIRVLILAPTRELAAQIGKNLEDYSQNLTISSAVVFGGVKINPQISRLRKGVDILVATPGRLMDLHSQNAVNFSQCQCLVLDEADRMLDMGFIHDIKRICRILPKERQNLLFSATFSDEVRALAKDFISQPIEISVNRANSTAELVNQTVYPVDKKQKPALLVELIHKEQWQQALVFTKTKHGANRLVSHLEREGIVAAAIHGNKSQAARTKALDAFKRGAVRILVATDIAARGLDIDQLPHVVNFDIPQAAEDYVHRIGRTGRAGCKGHAVSLVCFEEYPLLSAIERLIQKILPRVAVDGFEISNELPPSHLNRKPIKTKTTKPNVNKSSRRASTKIKNKRTSPGTSTKRKSSEKLARKS